MSVIQIARRWYAIRQRHPGGCTFDFVAGPFATEHEARDKLLSER